MSRAILFDYDDTLVRTREARVDAIRALAAEQYGCHLEGQTIVEHWGKPYYELFRCLFDELERDTSLVISAYEREYVPRFPLEAYPGAVDLVSSLAAQKVVGIVTSAGRSVVERDLRRLGFPLNELAILQCAEDTEFHKPDPRVRFRDSP